MKKYAVQYHIYSLVSALVTVWLLVACQPRVFVDEPNKRLVSEGGWVTCTFNPMILSFGEPRSLRATTKEPTVNSLIFFVFDGNTTSENATLLYTSIASKETNGSFSVQLKQSNSPRVIHVVGNYDGTLPNESKMVDKDERELIAQLQGEGRYFWQRIVTKISSDGIGANLQLLRSYAKIALEVAPGAGLSNASIKVFNMAKKGTVAPFNTKTLRFDENALTIAPGTTYETTPGYHDAHYLPESLNSEDHPIFIVVKGIYQGKTNYYKIDLSERIVGETDPLKQLHPLNLVRNYQYRILIKNVKQAGASTEEEAAKGLAINSSAIDYALDAFPAIFSADGKRSLSVEHTVYNVSAETPYIEALFSYMENGEKRNKDVEISVLEEDDSNPMIRLVDEQFKEGGVLKIHLNRLSSDQSARRARVLISSTNNNETMLRSILIVQYAAFSLEPALVNGSNPVYISDDVDINNTPIKISFSIPNDYPSHLYPIPVKIRTNTLTPTHKNMLPLAVDEDGIVYTYMAGSPGVKTLEFRLNKSGTSEAIQISAPNFYTATTGYNLGRFMGNITYIYQGNEPKPLPYSEGSLIRSSIGRMNMPSRTEGRYTIFLPLSLLESTTPTNETVEITARVITQEPGHAPTTRVYSEMVPIEQYRLAYQADKNNPSEIDVELQHTSTLFQTAIAGVNYNGATHILFPKHTDVSATLKGGSKEVIGKITNPGVLELLVPIESVDARDFINIQVRYLTITKHAGVVEETYTKSLPLSALNSPMVLPRTALSVFGESVYGVLSLPVKPEHIFQVTKKGENPGGLPAIKVTQPKRYRADLPPDTREEDVFDFKYKVVVRLFKASMSLKELREDSHIYLR